MNVNIRTASCYSWVSKQVSVLLFLDFVLLISFDMKRQYIAQTETKLFSLLSLSHSDGLIKLLHTFFFGCDFFLIIKMTHNIFNVCPSRRRNWHNIHFVCRKFIIQPKKKKTNGQWSYRLIKLYIATKLLLIVLCWIKQIGGIEGWQRNTDTKRNEKYHNGRAKISSTCRQKCWWRKFVANANIIYYTYIYTLHTHRHQQTITM